MDELDKARGIELTGLRRDEALTAFRERTGAWGVALPPAEPLVLDFGLGEFDRTGLIECWIANEIDAGYCAKYLFVFDGQACPMHHHREKVETFFVVHGRVRMTLDGRAREMGPGDVQLVQSGCKHSFTGLGPALLLEVSRPCVIRDNYFEDARIDEAVKRLESR